MRSKFLVSVLLMTCSLSSFAHAVWIETDAKGEKGKQQTVNIFFGEYSSGKPDSTAKWFSNMRDIQVQLTSPDGSRKQLTLQQTTDHYTANFTPDANGVYIISVAHTVADVYSDSKIEYYASASVNVNASGYGALTKATQLSVEPATPIQLDKPVSITVFNDQTALSAAKVVIDAPGGWSKTLYSDVKGNISFVPPAPGRYMIEAVRNDKTPGSHNGKPYKVVAHLATYCILVKP